VQQSRGGAGGKKCGDGDEERSLLTLAPRKERMSTGYGKVEEEVSSLADSVFVLRRSSANSRHDANACQLKTQNMNCFNPRIELGQTKYGFGQCIGAVLEKLGSSAM